MKKAIRFGVAVVVAVGCFTGSNRAAALCPDYPRCMVIPRYEYIPSCNNNGVCEGDVLDNTLSKPAPYPVYVYRHESWVTCPNDCQCQVWGCSACVLRVRPDVAYNMYVWRMETDVCTAGNVKKIVNDWCTQLDPQGCYDVMKTTCAAYCAIGKY